jgi:hypothetical protein
MSLGSNPYNLNPPSNNDLPATCVTLNDAKSWVFTPAVSGTYEFSTCT